MRIAENKILITALTLTFALFAFGVHAQVRATDITLSISPLYPAPNENITASINSYTADLNKAYISWRINGQESIAGIGKKVFSFNSDKLGAKTSVEARIETIDGQSIVKSTTITSSQVDMLWEANDSYVPPFYKGKAMASKEGTLKVVAMPSLTISTGKINDSNLSYSWTKDGNNQLDSSGWGKNSFVFQNSYLDETNEIEVIISDISGNANMSGKITLQTANPKILFYQKDPGLGTKWETALNDEFAINPNGDTIVAEPYFFSPKDLSDPSLKFDWSLNGESIDTPNPKNTLSVKLESGKSGTALIKVAVQNTKTLFQELEKQISINF